MNSNRRPRCIIAFTHYWNTGTIECTARESERKGKSTVGRYYDPYDLNRRARNSLNSMISHGLLSFFVAYGWFHRYSKSQVTLNTHVLHTRTPPSKNITKKLRNTIVRSTTSHHMVHLCNLQLCAMVDCQATPFAQRSWFTLTSTWLIQFDRRNP
jgi:hypothetical protein